MGLFGGSKSTSLSTALGTEIGGATVSSPVDSITNANTTSVNASGSNLGTGDLIGIGTASKSNLPISFGEGVAAANSNVNLTRDDSFNVGGSITLDQSVSYVDPGAINLAADALAAGLQSQLTIASLYRDINTARIGEAAAYSSAFGALNSAVNQPPPSVTVSTTVPGSNQTPTAAPVNVAAAGKYLLIAAAIVGIAYVVKK